MAGKLLDRESLALSWPRVRSGEKIVTNGCFDLVHAGHVRYLREAASRMFL